MAVTPLTLKDGTMVNKYEISSVPIDQYSGVTTAIGYYNYWKALYPLNGQEQATIAADDDAAVTTLKNVPPIKSEIPLAKKFATGTEGHFGFFAASSEASIDVTRVSAIATPFGDSRGYLTRSAPLIGFSVHPPDDCKSVNAKVYEGTDANGENVLLFTARYSKYSSDTTNAVTVCFKFSSNGIEFFTEQHTSFTFKAQMAGFNKTASTDYSSSTPVLLTTQSSGNSIKKITMITTTYKTSGQITGNMVIPDMDRVRNSQINYTAVTPAGTTVVVKAIAKPVGMEPAESEYVAVANGAAIPGITAQGQAKQMALYYKVELSTTDPNSTPSISNIKCTTEDTPDLRYLYVEFAGTQKFRNCVGPLILNYASGALSGADGTVSGFSKEVNKVNLDPIPPQNYSENFKERASVDVTPIITRIGQRKGYTGSETFATAALTDIQVVMTNLNIIQ